MFGNVFETVQNVFRQSSDFDNYGVLHWAAPQNAEN